MKKQNTAVRRAALAVLYLAVFAAAVMYLRVTISVPAEGDDKLTLNGWLYDMGRMSFWQYALQDLKERLSFFLLKQVRFFPFHYPNAVALLFYRTLASYRLYIIAMTGAAAFLVSRVAAKLSRSNALALGAFGPLGEVADGHGNAQRAQVLHGGGVVHVAALHGESHGMQDLGERAHRHAADAGEVHPLAGHEIGIDIHSVFLPKSTHSDSLRHLPKSARK